MLTPSRLYPLTAAPGWGLVSVLAALPASFLSGESVGRHGESRAESGADHRLLLRDRPEDGGDAGQG